MFQTVDIGDIIQTMVSEIERWENVTGEQLNQPYSKSGLTTLPSVYHVMAMAVRPKKVTGKGTGESLKK